MEEGKELPPEVQKQLDALTAEEYYAVEDFQQALAEAELRLTQRCDELLSKKRQVWDAYQAAPDSYGSEPETLPEPIEFEDEPYSRAMRGLILALLISLCFGCACLAILCTYLYLFVWR